MVRIEGSTPIEDIAQRIEKAPLLKKDENGNDILPYRNAQITFEDIAINSFRPTTLYVVRKNLEAQIRLSKELAAVGQDPLELDSALRITDDDQEYDLIPPIVEEDKEDGLILVDGAHRIYVARQCGRPIVRALILREVDPEYPIYAHANNWDEVIEYDETPPTHLKKKYRVDDPYALYRDFSGFSTTSPRKQTA